MVTYVAGALTELSRIPENRELFFNSGGVQALLRYQMSTDWQLIVNVNNALANCALHPPSLALVHILTAAVVCVECDRSMRACGCVCIIFSQSA